MGRRDGETLRDRAIALRQQWIADELRAIPRYRSCELGTAEERREAGHEYVAHLRSEVRTLEAMPVTVSDEDVRRAMGVAS